MYEGICDAIHHEMEKLDEKLGNGAQLTSQELAHIDLMAHALKSLATYDAMRNASGFDGSYDGESYARGRSRTTGRYVSRDEYRRY